MEKEEEEEEEEEEEVEGIGESIKTCDKVGSPDSSRFYRVLPGFTGFYRVFIESGRGNRPCGQGDCFFFIALSSLLVPYQQRCNEFWGRGAKRIKEDDDEGKRKRKRETGKKEEEEEEEEEEEASAFFFVFRRRGAPRADLSLVTDQSRTLVSYFSFFFPLARLPLFFLFEPTRPGAKQDGGRRKKRNRFPQSSRNRLLDAAEDLGRFAPAATRI